MCIDRMEAVVLGSKRTIPFWRVKRPLLNLERALAPLRQIGGKGAMAAPVLVRARARGRLATEAKKLGRFSEQ
jgi:hypothetical protein